MSFLKVHYLLHVKFKLNSHGLCSTGDILDKNKVIHTLQPCFFICRTHCHLIRKAVNKIQESLHSKVYYQEGNNSRGGGGEE